jgi:nickel-dependent lactate racemase
MGGQGLGHDPDQDPARPGQDRHLAPDVKQVGKHGEEHAARPAFSQAHTCEMNSNCNTGRVWHDDSMRVDAESICRAAVADWPVQGRRILLVVPDRTRTCPVAEVFHHLHRALAGRAACVDVMIALGTHAALPEAVIMEHLGITPEERRGVMRDVKLMNHAWDDPSQLTSLGTLPADDIAGLSQGRFRMEVEVRVNRVVREYDMLMVLGPVFPHEVAGFSGGNKYFFPGISGPEVLNFFHWLGAVITNPDIIGYTYTPVRAVIDRAASMIPAERKAICMVVEGKALAGLYAGEVETAWSQAADHSARLHIREVAKPFHTVFAVVLPCTMSCGRPASACTSRNRRWRTAGV